MKICEWNDLPGVFRNEKVYPYFVLLRKKQGSLRIKRLCDLLMAIPMTIVLSPVMLLIALSIKIDDASGSVIYKQIRVTQFAREFTIYKFRTMVKNADKVGAQVTSNSDGRVTKVGKVLRKYRLDEILQLFNILKGDMTFVGTRPEVPEYVQSYTEEMYATLLLPAGLTSLASICYKDEERLLNGVGDVNTKYVKEVLPGKMKYNLETLKKFGLIEEWAVMLKTVAAVFRNN